MIYLDIVKGIQDADPSVEREAKEHGIGALINLNSIRSLYRLSTEA